MNCPTCHGSKLLVHERFGVIQHHCPCCRGVWLERQALDHLSERTGLFLKERQAGFPSGRAGSKKPLWKEIFDAE